MEQLFYNGDIITMENKDDHPEAVLVRNGVIATIGNYHDLKAVVYNADSKTHAFP